MTTFLKQSTITNKDYHFDIGQSLGIHRKEITEVFWTKVFVKRK